MYVSILAVTGLVAESNCQSMCMCTCFQHWTHSAFVDRYFLHHLVTTISTQIHFSRVTSRLTNIPTVCTKSELCLLAIASWHYWNTAKIWFSWAIWDAIWERTINNENYHRKDHKTVCKN